MSLQTMTEIDLDINQPGVVVVHAKQYDTVRQVKAHLFYNGVKWLVPSSNYVAVVGFKKADRIGGFYDTTEDGRTAVSVDQSDRSIIYILLDRNTVTTPGNCMVEVTFYDSITTGRLSTFSFILQVEEATVTELDLTSSPYFNILAEDIKKVIEASDAMTGLSADATQLAPGDDPSVEVSGGTSAADPFVFHLGIPSMPGMTATASKLASSANPTAVVSGGQQPGQAFNIAFGIPEGIGIKRIDVKYGVSMSESTLPSSWVNSITELTIPDGSLMWTWNRVIYDDDTYKDSYIKAVQGYPGPPGVAVQDTEPDTTVKFWIDPSDETSPIVIPEYTADEDAMIHSFSGVLLTTVKTITP